VRDDDFNFPFHAGHYGVMTTEAAWSVRMLRN
jgi:hypothetical protein